MIDNFFNDVFGKPLGNVVRAIDSHGLLAWGVVILLALFFYLPAIFAPAEVWKSKILIPLASRLRFGFLVRAAIKSDVKGHVNRAVQNLTPQLPVGWIKDIDIRWVNNETPEQFFENNAVVIKVRPLDDQDCNFVTVVHMFLRKALFGDVASIIPPLQRTAAILYFGDRIATARGEGTAEAFGKRIFEPAVEGKNKIRQRPESCVKSVTA